MKTQTILSLAAILASAASHAVAGVSAEDAAQLGKSLTLTGAVKAGSPSGIPEYTGGLTTPPPNWKPGLNHFPDPFADEKPTLRIDAGNVDKYADKLSAGVIKVIKTKPGYYLNVYPTHRTFALPKNVVDATVRNASNPACKTSDGGVTLEKACRGGLPFPIPKTGYEVMWNKLVNYQPPQRSETSNWLVDATGNIILNSSLEVYGDRLNYYGTPDQRKETDAYVNLLANITAPARSAGQAQGVFDFLNPLQKPSHSFFYSPGQRRIRIAPEFTYDTPNGQLGGAQLFDEIYLFSGAMDRFDFKLAGKKEMYIPYNNYKAYFGCGDEKVLLNKAGYVNPECERWELHRVWVVEATLKPGARHVYKKRFYYWDEDNYASGLYDAWDQNDTLYRSGYQYSIQIYDADNLGTYFGSYPLFDFQKNMMAFTTHIKVAGGGVRLGKPLSETQATPEAYVATKTQR